jgi:elongation factor P--(R)-beta-lysine ligase
VIRGRVIAKAGEVVVVRTAGGDREVPGGAAVEPGDLVEADAGVIRRIRAHPGGDYPTPDAELIRLAPRRQHLVDRARAVRAIRGFFEERGFLEIETPLRVRAPALEVHLTAVPAGDHAWLITSPEYQMKRLLAGGLEQIFQVCKCFRAGERGHQHAVEFTMLEWYRAWAELDAVLVDTEQLVAHVATQVRGEPVVEAGGRRIDVAPPWPRLTVAEAMHRWAGVEVRGDEPVDTLAARVDAAGIDRGGAAAWDDVFFAAFVARVEPALAALDRPVVLVDWPAPLAALARRKPADAAVAERFEAYVGGVELANAFGELTDPVEQRARFDHDVATRAARGLPAYPLDERLLAALAEGIPPSAGIALGVDRLVMLVVGAADIRDVLTFTDDEL